MTDVDSFGDPLSSSTDPFSFDSASSPFTNNSQTNNDSFGSPSPFDSDEASINLFRQLSAEGFAQTPPMSPKDKASSSRKDYKNVCIDPMIQRPSATPSGSSLQSNPFTTPPTSPAEPANDDLDDLFNSFQDGATCSPYELDMKAMNDFTSIDCSQYALLDFM